MVAQNGGEVGTAHGAAGVVGQSPEVDAGEVGEDAHGDLVGRGRGAPSGIWSTQPPPAAETPPNSSVPPSCEQ